MSLQYKTYSLSSTHHEPQTGVLCWLERTDETLYAGIETRLDNTISMSFGLSEDNRKLASFQQKDCITYLRILTENDMASITNGHFAALNPKTSCLCYLSDTAP